ncbi:unnamed protein product [Prunus brigantina]
MVILRGQIFLKPASLCPPSVSLSLSLSLSLSRRLPPPSLRSLRHRPPQVVRPDPIEPPPLPLPIPTKLSRHHRQQPPENTENRAGFDRFSHRSFSLDSPPNRTSEAPEHQLTRSRDLPKVQRARTTSDRRASESHHRAFPASRSSSF